VNLGRIIQLWFPWKIAEKFVVFVNLAFISFCQGGRGVPVRSSPLLWMSFYYYSFSRKERDKVTYLVLFACFFCLLFSRELQARR